MRKAITLFSILFFAVSQAQAQQSYSSFLPEPGKYLVSGWVKQAPTEIQVKSYSAKIIVTLYNASTANSYTFTPQGNIIDGWQQIIGVIDIAPTDSSIDIELRNNNLDLPLYFDDIRFLPFKGNMKSFAYDNETLRLMAELDENNYATYYEYDIEGGLVRVKKETEKGIFTIQETRSNTRKNGN